MEKWQIESVKGYISLTKSGIKGLNAAFENLKINTTAKEPNKEGCEFWVKQTLSWIDLLEGHLENIRDYIHLD